MPQPRTAVILPAFNVKAFVPHAIASLHAQTLTDFEVIAVDDGSSDGTAEVLDALAESWAAESRSLTVVRQRNGGSAAARNAGLALAEGTFVAFLDADDLWYPHTLDRLVQELDSNPELDVAFPLYRYVDQNGEPLGIESRRDHDRFGFADIFTNNPIDSTTAVVARRQAVDEVGGFDASLDACVDLDLWLRLTALRPGNIGCVREVLADHRRHRDGQITSNWRRMRESWARVADKAERQRPEEAPQLRPLADGRMAVYWSALAYQSGDFAAARSHMWTAWRRGGLGLASDKRVWMRTVAALTSLLPAALHRNIGRAFNAIRTRLGLHFS